MVTPWPLLLQRGYVTRGKRHEAPDGPSPTGKVPLSSVRGAPGSADRFQSKTRPKSCSCKAPENRVHTETVVVRRPVLSFQRLKTCSCVREKNPLQRSWLLAAPRGSSSSGSAQSSPTSGTSLQQETHRFFMEISGRLQPQLSGLLHPPGSPAGTGLRATQTLGRPCGTAGCQAWGGGGCPREALRRVSAAPGIS